MPSGRHAAKAAPKLKSFRRRWPRRVLYTTNAIVFVLIALSATAYGWARYQLAQINRVRILGLTVQGHSSQSKPSSGSSIAPFTLLAVGSDTRNISGGGQFQATSGTTVAGQRSDSIILIRVIPATKSLALLSIPRDTEVPVPGYGTTRINTAFNSGNPQLLVQVLQQDFGIQVNHYASTNFDTFEQISNAVGGVNVWFPAPARDLESDLGEPAGCQNLIGIKALAFVRSRNYEYYLDGSWHLQLYPESDLGRIQRQQAFVKLALQKAKSIAPSNVATLTSLISGIAKNLTLDSSFSDSLLVSLAETYRSASLANIPQYTYPTENVPDSGALQPLTKQGQQVIQEWLNGGPVPAGSPGSGSSSTSTSSSSSSTSSTTSTTLVSPSSVAVEVANGSGASGQAGQAGRDLSGLGYGTTVSASRYYPSQTSNLILYAPDSQTDARQLQSQLVGGATLMEDSSLTQSPYNLELVTGSDYGGVTGASSSSHSSSTSGSSTSGSSGSGSSGSSSGDTTTTVSPAISGSTTVEPDSSSYVNGQYIPPGRTPGQQVVSCPN